MTWLDPGTQSDVITGLEMPVRKTIETFSFYSQCFLMLGLSFERWVNVCRPHDVKIILRKRNRVLLNFFVVILPVAISIPILIDYFLNIKAFMKSNI